MTHAMDRRRLMTGTAAVLGLGWLSLPALAQEKRLRMFWWGSKERADRTFKGNKLYSAKNPGVKIDGETIGWSDYWPRMATQAAGRNLADVIQMDYRYIFEYARRGALLDLNPYVGKALDLSGFDKNSIDCGKVDGKLYGINLGNNSTAMLANISAFEGAGLKVPTGDLTWDEYGKLCAELTKAAKKDGFYGSMDSGGLEPSFEVFVRQRGKNLYSEDGKAGFSAEDASDWFAYWDGLRQSKACVPADVQALDKQNIETNPLTLGKAAVAFAHSNQLVGYQAVNPNKLSIGMYPSGGAGAKPGQYLKPSMFFSVAGTSKNPEDAVKVINFVINDPEGVKAYGVERGVPPSSKSRDLIAADLDALGKAQVDYIASVTSKVGPLPPPPPKGAGEIAFLLRRTNEEVGFGRIKPAEAGKKFLTEASSILSRG
ncbi:MAG: ABC transporter substrate-binding protein [Proteobacteria bacterium]|nr:ABC transporter substrate-binding protein [Pseudomonadota bacterium]